MRFFSKFLVLALPLLAAATAVPRTGDDKSSVEGNGPNYGYGDMKPNKEHDKGKHDKGNNKNEHKKCITGSMQCCNKVQDIKEVDTTLLNGLLGDISLESITGLVGLSCNPMSTVVGVNDYSCPAQPVCCKKNDYNGAVALDCNHVNFNA